MNLNVVIRLSFWLSVAAVIVGYWLGRHTMPVLKYYIHFLHALPYSFVIYVVTLGFPLSWMNAVECEQLWGRVFNRRGIEFIGISGGIFLGMLSLW